MDQESFKAGRIKKKIVGKGKLFFEKKTLRGGRKEKDREIWSKKWRGEKRRDKEMGGD